TTDPAARIPEIEIYTTAPLAVSQATGSAPCQASESADKAFDGVVAWNAKWCSLVASKWVQAQFASDQTVTDIVIRHAEAGVESPAWTTKDYDIQTSLDGTTWSTALQVRGNTAAVTNHRLAVPVTARYVKIVVITPTQTTDPAARIPEIEFYNSPSPG